MNGLLPVGIVLFRVFHACYPRRVMTAVQKRDLNYSILTLTLGVSVVLTGVALYYKDHYGHYHKCINKDYDGPTWDLPLSHPFQLACHVFFLSRTLLVPIGYILIFLSRKKDANDAPGISEKSRKMRRTRNAVSAKFNFLIWLSEMSSFIVFIFEGPISDRIYLIISFGVSPLLYLAGMEETRIRLQLLAKNLF